MNRLKIYLILIAMAFVALAGCKDKGTDPQSNETSTLTYNGYTYKTVKIGNQWWLAENLRTTRYNNRTNIPNVTAFSEWENLTTGAYCVYYDDNQYAEKYGYLYNYYAVETGKLAPEGWRIPTTKDWEELIAFCGGEDLAGEKLKSKTGWDNGNGSDAYGFCAYPAGFRRLNVLLDGFIDEGHTAYWWAGETTKYFRIRGEYPRIYTASFSTHKIGSAVRLVKE